VKRVTTVCHSRSRVIGVTIDGLARRSVSIAASGNPWVLIMNP
jgi:hypothetical protein